MAAPSYILVHYGEIALKKGNRPYFVRRLRENLEAAVGPLGVRSIVEKMGRLVLRLDPGGATAEIAARLARTFGVVSFAPALRAPRDLEGLTAAVEGLVAGRRFESFRITARRADPAYPHKSPEVERHLGAAVQRLTGARVDLERPASTVYVEILPGEAICYVDRAAGPGGLPVGSSGTVTALLSGGIDSPVAAFRMLKRGARVHFVHFSGQPFHDTRSMEKAEELAAVLATYQGPSRLAVVPFGEIQREVVLAVPVALRVLVYRRLMMRIAGCLAAADRAKALVTGESLGQVASQTLENLAVVEAASPLPLLRPLIGMDKAEIIAQARAIGTYEISIEPDQDCCRLFVPKHPATRATADEVAAAEKALDVEALVRRGVQGAQERKIAVPRITPRHAGAAAGAELRVAD
ncbi:MAG TPA: tRNA uracil 4-sulfurtransferase ThiI [Candidatus Methylomirabilis sp.]|jgi:thiamine biosynthesis protein ThiI